MFDLGIEEIAPRILLKRGVKVPITAPLFFRLFGKKEIRLVLRQPTARTLLKIAAIACETNYKEEMDLKEALEFYKTNAKKVHKIVALSILNSPRKNWLASILARQLRRQLTEQHLLYLYQLVVAQGGVQDFMNTIRLVMQTRITRPMNLSPEEKTS